MKGKTLVISGGTKGIGKECVYKSAKNGVNVAFTYNSNQQFAEDICKDVEDKFGVKLKFPNRECKSCRRYPCFRGIEKCSSNFAAYGCTYYRELNSSN